MASTTFLEIRIGGLFHANGNDYTKQSTRTAKMLSNGRTFYFKNNEIVNKIAY